MAAVVCHSGLWFIVHPALGWVPEGTKDTCLSLPPVPFSPPLTSQSAFSLSILPLRAAPGATIPFLLLSPEASRTKYVEEKRWASGGLVLG